MIKPPVPANEEARLAALHALEILDTPAEERFDRITRLAQTLLDVPIAYVALIDANRQWFKSCQGLGGAETSRDVSFCGWAIMQDEMLVIPDAYEDKRFADNPLVTGEPFIRFYCGQSLKSAEGLNVGTLCLVDRKPRALTQRDHDREPAQTLEALSSLGAAAIDGYARQERMRQQIQALRIRIDATRRDRDVAEITETAYFRDLLAKADKFREDA